MAASQDPLTPDDLVTNATGAMSDIRTILSGVAPAERAAFWHAVDLLYHAPSETPMSTKDLWPIQHGVALGLKLLLPPVWNDGSDADDRNSRLSQVVSDGQTFEI
ncbi:hypothetical protein MPEAHAMD_5618 [Methylobacterium frigidaeris]|uniref:Uncharacterized protein n=2 Tax=Methylobacterium frigidaeris TaxID=2038277 RepID=A0AA37HGQ8_9HYPH|nr:hypothetical protein MPEAHAMD_5618 [Methylobacterium frigidaeris]